MQIKEIILFLLLLYFLIGFLQLINVFRVKKQISKQKFSKKDFFVSVIVPIKESSDYLEKCLDSICIQDYKNFEVLFVAEKEEDSGCEIAKKIVKKYKNTRLLISGEHDFKKTIAKSHNLIYGVKHAKGDVFLFTDSDVIHQKNWIKELTAPIDEKIDGKIVHATTSPFFSLPKNFLGAFTSLSTNFALFFASFVKLKQMFPSYASGASMCVKKEVFLKAGIEKAWMKNFNDDLVFASTLIQNGFNIFNVRNHPNYPIEKFGNWKRLNEKMRRWMLTITYYIDKSFKKEAVLLTAKNLQFQITILIAIILGILNILDLFNVNFFFIGIIIILAYLYSVIFRAIICKIVNEKNILKYVFLAPFSHLFFGNYYLIVRIFYKSFYWGGHKYYLR